MNEVGKYQIPMIDQDPKIDCVERDSKISIKLTLRNVHSKWLIESISFSEKLVGKV